MYRVAVVTSHPIQYQAPWFRALSQVVDLEVFFCHRPSAQDQADAGFGVPFEWDVPLLEGYRHQWLPNVSAAPDVSRFPGCDTPDVGRYLAEGRFDACIVNGWYLKSYVQAIRACWRHDIRLLVRGDSHLKTPRSRAKTAMKFLPYRWFLRRIDAHLFVGAANRRYLKSYGVADDRLFFAPHFVDNEFFATGAERARRDGSRASLRRSIGADDDSTVFLFAGKLVAKKRARDFITALALLRRRGHANVRGLIAGSGPLQKDLEAYARRLDVAVHFTGFQNQSELPVCYAAADALVLPSDGGETWGLVVNEAMACGVPAIVSDQVGCGDDLIRRGETGFTFECGDVARLGERMAALMRLLLVNGARIRQDTQAVVRPYSADAAAIAVLQALDAAVEAREVTCLMR